MKTFLEKNSSIIGLPPQPIPRHRLGNNRGFQAVICDWKLRVLKLSAVIDFTLSLLTNI
jgi:hypothetical protein